MTTYIVTSKATGQEVYRYAADAPIEWAGMEFVTHNHTPDVIDEGVTDAPVVVMTWTKLEYLRRFTQDERIAIRTAAKSVPQLEDYMALLELASEVRSDDPDIISALQMLEFSGLIGEGRAQEILNGN
jgi:uncharacterized protein (DUF1330 family)